MKRKELKDTFGTRRGRARTEDFEKATLFQVLGRLQSPEGTGLPSCPSNVLAVHFRTLTRAFSIRMAAFLDETDCCTSE